MTPNLVFFIGSQTFAFGNYGNKTWFCQIRFAGGGQTQAVLIIRNFSEKPNTFSYACSGFRMEYARHSPSSGIEAAGTKPALVNGRHSNHLIRKREQ
jgi:hypothetical protein